MGGYRVCLPDVLEYRTGFPCLGPSTSDQADSHVYKSSGRSKSWGWETGGVRPLLMPAQYWKEEEVMIAALKCPPHPMTDTSP
jgi:hypothetical protein